MRRAGCGGRRSLRIAAVLCLLTASLGLASCTECGVGIIISPIVITWPPPCQAVSLVEDFSTDVIADGTWTRSGDTVSVDTGSGWLVIQTGDGGGDFARRDVGFALPITFEARVRLVSGGNDYKTPGSYLYFSDGTYIKITFLTDVDPGDTHGGWLFDGWTFISIKGPLAENQWITVRAEIRTDGGDLWAKEDADADFTHIVSKSWSVPDELDYVRLKQSWDSICNVDYVRIDGCRR